MSDILADNRRLAAETSSFLLACLRAGMETANAILARPHVLTEIERQRLQHAFMACGLAIDAIEAEAKRERVGLAYAFPPQVLDSLEQHAKAFAGYAKVLENEGELFVRNFYLKLRERLTQYYMHGGRPRKMRPRGSEIIEPQIRLHGRPTPQRGYEAIAKKTGRYEEIRQEAKKTAELARQDQAYAEERRQAEAREAEAAAKAEVAAEPAAEVVEEVAKESAEEDAAEPAAEAASQPVAEAVASMPETKAPTKQPHKPEFKPPKDDAIWHDPRLKPIAADYVLAIQEWHKHGSGPPPTPPRKLRRAVAQNPNGNPMLKGLLDGINDLRNI